MTALFMILGGAAGGVLGWLFDRAAEKRGKVKPADTCEVPARTSA